MLSDDVTGKQRGEAAPTFLDFLGWLLFGDEFGDVLRKPQLVSVSGHLCDGLHTPWITGRGRRAGVITGC